MIQDFVNASIGVKILFVGYIVFIGWGNWLAAAASRSTEEKKP